MVAPAPAFSVAKVKSDTRRKLSIGNLLEKTMEVFQLLLASKDGLIALASVSLALTMLVSTLGAVAYKAKRSGR